MEEAVFTQSEHEHDKEHAQRHGERVLGGREIQAVAVEEGKVQGGGFGFVGNARGRGGGGEVRVDAGFSREQVRKKEVKKKK